MELQTNPTLKIRTPRIKALAVAKDTDEILVCLYTGEIQLYNSKTLKMTRSAKISDSSLRTGAIIHSKDWILAAGDDGLVYIVDFGTLRVLQKISAHDDFVRKIEVNEETKRIITVSDDNITKLWSYEHDFALVNVYKDSKHYVMDAAFCPSDPGFFVTVSLDCRARLYSVSGTKMLKKFKGHEKGINTLGFVSDYIFVSGDDSPKLLLFDYKSGNKIAELTGHTNNITKVYKLSKGFSTCSEDGTVRFWNDDYSLSSLLHVGLRIWSICEKNGRIFIGTDEELVVYEEHKIDLLGAVCDSKLIFNSHNKLKMIKLSGEEYSGQTLVGTQIGVAKDLAELEENILKLKISQNGKIIGVETQDSVKVYSALGFRKKCDQEGSDLFFIDDDLFIIRNDEAIERYEKYEQTGYYKVNGLKNILYADSDIIVANIKNRQDIATAVISMADLKDGEEVSDFVHIFETAAENACVLGEYLVLFGDKMKIFDSSFEQIAECKERVASYGITENVLVYETGIKSFYGFVAEGKFHSYPLRNTKEIVGISKGYVFVLGDSIRAEKLDMEFINFQMSVLCGETVAVSDSLASRAIGFYEQLGMHEQALACCKDPSMAFEIYLKKGDLEKAAETAGSSIQFRKLGKCFMERGEMEQAAECFYKGKDLNSLLLADVFGAKKYLKEIGEISRLNNINNLSFVAFFKSGDYSQCLKLLEDGPYSTLFEKNYCENQSL
ncbi:coatomer subunit beta' [Enteropsectra breve]|nr:coatomer subunit beta' [Enteropsectra breve]